MTYASGAIAAVLASVALFLAGCGSSGSGSQTHDCVNNGKFNIVTQTLSGTGTLNLNVEKPITFDLKGGTAKISSKMDMDKLSVREDVEVNIKLQGKSMDVKTKMFFDYDKALVAVAGEVSGDVKESKCSYMKLTGMKEKYTVEQIKAGIQLLVGLINKEMPCKSNDGTYDTFELTEKIPDDRIPLNQTGFSGSLTAETLCDKDLMLHSTSINLDLTTPAKRVDANTTIPAAKIHVDAKFPVDGGVGKPQGPADTDLDYSTWGLNCTEFKPPNNTHGSIHAFFMERRADAIKAVLGKTHDLGHVLALATSSPAPNVMLQAIDLLEKKNKPASLVV